MKYCTENLPRYYHVDALQDIQVLTPMQRGVCGAANLNQVLQEAMNPGISVICSGMAFNRLYINIMSIMEHSSRMSTSPSSGFSSLRW